LEESVIAFDTMETFLVWATEVLILIDGNDELAESVDDKRGVLAVKGTLFSLAVNIRLEVVLKMIEDSMVNSLLFEVCRK
jgi:hypothetical protein